MYARITLFPFLLPSLFLRLFIVLEEDILRAGIIPSRTFHTIDSMLTNQSEIGKIPQEHVLGDYKLSSVETKKG